MASFYRFPSFAWSARRAGWSGVAPFMHQPRQILAACCGQRFPTPRAPVDMSGGTVWFRLAGRSPTAQLHFDPDYDQFVAPGWTAS